MSSNAVLKFLQALSQNAAGAVRINE